MRTHAPAVRPDRRQDPSGQCRKHRGAYEAEPAAYWALLATDVELRRTAYDVEAAIAEIAATGYPKADEMVTFLTHDLERPARITALIERLP